MNECIHGEKKKKRKETGTKQLMFYHVSANGFSYEYMW